MSAVYESDVEDTSMNIDPLSITESIIIIKNDFPLDSTLPVEQTSAIRQSSGMEETPILIGDNLLAQPAPVFQHTPAIRQSSGMRKTPALRRSTRVVPKPTSKITKISQKQSLIKSNIQDKAAQLLGILRSKGEGAKIEKPSLTPEEIDEDMILMGILPNPSQAPYHAPAESPLANEPPVAKEDALEAPANKDLTAQDSLLRPCKP
jgi:hypothetical protein